LAATDGVDAALALPADALAYYGSTAAKAATNIENTSGRGARGRSGVIAVDWACVGASPACASRRSSTTRPYTGDYTTMDFGEPRIVIERCNRITSAAAPDWPRPGRHNLH
jgi:hypothetical protein